MISVIVPTVNREKQLDSLIESLENQTAEKENFEVIIVNDGSRYSNDIKKRIADSDISIEYVETSHQGPAAARNIGVSLSKGEILAFTDDDCIVSPNWIISIYHYFQNQNNSNFIAVGGAVEPIKKKGNIINGYLTFIGFLNGPIRNCGKITNMTTANLSIKRRSFLEVNGFDQNFYFSEDENLVWKLSKIGELDFYRQILVYHNHNIGFFHFCKKYINYGRGVRMHCNKSGEVLDSESPYWLYCSRKIDLIKHIFTVLLRSNERIVKRPQYDKISRFYKILYKMLSFLQEFLIQYGAVSASRRKG